MRAIVATSCVLGLLLAPAASTAEPATGDNIPSPSPYAPPCNYRGHIFTLMKVWSAEDEFHITVESAGYPGRPVVTEIEPPFRSGLKVDGVTSSCPAPSLFVATPAGGDRLLILLLADDRPNSDKLVGFIYDAATHQLISKPRDIAVSPDTITEDGPRLRVCGQPDGEGVTPPGLLFGSRMVGGGELTLGTCLILRATNGALAVTADPHRTWTDLGGRVRCLPSEKAFLSFFEYDSEDERFQNPNYQEVELEDGRTCIARGWSFDPKLAWSCCRREKPSKATLQKGRTHEGGGPL